MKLQVNVLQSLKIQEKYLYFSAFSSGFNYCNEHVCCLEKKRTDAGLPHQFVRKVWQCRIASK